MPAGAGGGDPADLRHLSWVAGSMDLCGKHRLQAWDPLSLLLPLNPSSHWEDSDRAGQPPAGLSRTC